jgi:hypothetical protein
MRDLLDTFQRRHQERLDQLQRGEVNEAFVDDVQALVADMRQAGSAVASPAERGQLRALMRFWGNVVYDHTGVYPDMTLQPLDPARKVVAVEEPGRRPQFPLIWALVGGAAVILIAVGLVGLSRFVVSEATPTPTPLAYVRQVAVGVPLDPSGAGQMAADTFCQGTPEIAAEFALENVEPGTMWKWEVKRGGGIVAHQEVRWTEEQRHSEVILTGGPEGVDPGQYELLIYVAGQEVGRHAFRVLDKAPRVFNLQISDVPQPPGEALPGAGGSEFEPGVRVIYLNYQYEGMCPGLVVSHALYGDGEPIQESEGTWSRDSEGRAQVSFQAPGDQPFSPGGYEIAVAIAGEEQERVGLVIEAQVVEKHPTFGDITIALGVEPDGQPILTSSNDVFDWNTKVVYAIFDHVEMRDGLEWGEVWMRNGEEVARREHFWDVATDGVDGTRWVAYYDDRGRVLPGGSYSVTLYSDDAAQRMADFSILYYVPPEGEEEQ